MALTVEEIDSAKPKRKPDRLTIKAIDSAKPRRKPYRLTDGGGLCLLVNPNGSKLWRYRYDFCGEQTLTLGEYPVITLKDARDLHFEARKVLAAGINPMAERKARAQAKQKAASASQQEAENTFEKVARKWWAWWSKNITPDHAATVMDRLEGDVFPAYGHKPIDTVTANDVLEVMLAIEARGAHDIAKRARETTSQIFGSRSLANSQAGIRRLTSSKWTFWSRLRSSTTLA